MTQRFWEEILDREEVSPLNFPLTVYRLVMAAGGNRDFNAIHHNSIFAQRTGAPEMYANTFFLQGMWERVARRFFGDAGHIVSLRGFRMHSFNTVGDTAIVSGRVNRKWCEDETGFVELMLETRNSKGLSIGPGFVVGSLPLRKS